MELKFKVLIVSAKADFLDRFQQVLAGLFDYLVCASVFEAEQCVEKSEGEIAVVLLDFELCQTQDPAMAVHSIQGRYYPEIILCVHPGKLLNTTMSTIIKLIKFGASRILELPSFSEEIVLFVQKSVSHYRSQRQLTVLAADSPEFKERMAAFFELMNTRHAQGLPVTVKELSLFFPKSDTLDMPLPQLLDQVRRAPIQEFKTISVLIVEDEPDKTDMYTHYLKRFGYSIYCASSVADVRHVMAQDVTIDVVLLDIGLPDGAGNELIYSLKDRYPFCEIIMLTAWERFDLIVSTLKAGAFDYLIKSRAELDIVAQKIMQAHHKRLFNQLMVQRTMGKELE